MINDDLKDEMRIHKNTKRYTKKFIAAKQKMNLRLIGQPNELNSFLSFSLEHSHYVVTVHIRYHQIVTLFNFAGLAFLAATHFLWMYCTTIPTSTIRLNVHIKQFKVLNILFLNGPQSTPLFKVFIHIFDN